MDTPLVKRAYNLGLKAVPNFLTLSEEQIIYYEQNLDKIPEALARGFTVLGEEEHIIDLDSQPFIPYHSMNVEEHKKGGQFKWDPAKVKLFFNKKQQDGGIMEGNKLRKELADHPVYNANLLDYLVYNPHLIPEEWKSKMVFFWGTIYRGPEGTAVRYLYFRNNRWQRDHYWLTPSYGFSGSYSAVAAS